MFYKLYPDLVPGVEGEGAGRGHHQLAACCSHVVAVAATTDHITITPCSAAVLQCCSVSSPELQVAVVEGHDGVPAVQQHALAAQGLQSEADLVRGRGGARQLRPHQRAGLAAEARHRLRSGRRLPLAVLAAPLWAATQQMINIQYSIFISI